MKEIDGVSLPARNAPPAEFLSPNAEVFRDLQPDAATGASELQLVQL